MSSPALALTWDLAARQRRTFRVGILGLLAGTILTRGWLAAHGANSGASIVAHTVTALVLTTTFASVHFTEGARRGGFGGFPTRLFHLPVSTALLVAVPMVFAAVAMVGTYLACVVLLLRPVGDHPPLLWPSLYLVAGVTHFQAVVWSLARHPHWRLVCLGSGAALLAAAWMFFLPDMVAGTLSDWGYSGDPASFMSGMLMALALASPTAFGISWNRIRAQRHQPCSHRWSWPRSGRGRPPAGTRIRHSPFPSPHAALRWLEFRRTGWILPMAVAVLLLMTGIPTALGGDATGRVTAGVMMAMALAPLVLAMIIGCGMAKPDFWSNNPRFTSFQAVLPLPSGTWVQARLVSALASVTISWALTLLVAFLWLAWFGDFALLDKWWYGIRVYYTPSERALLAILIPSSAVILTWRFLISGLVTGLGGHTALRRLSDAWTAAVLALAFAFAIRNGNDEVHRFPTHLLWPWIQSLPGLLATAVVVKMGLAAWAWERVGAQRMLPAPSVVAIWTTWLLAVAILSATVFTLVHQTLWLRALLILAAVLSVPLARTGAAILALAQNRSHS